MCAERRGEATKISGGRQWAGARAATRRDCICHRRSKLVSVRCEMGHDADPSGGLRPGAMRNLLDCPAPNDLGADQAIVFPAPP